MVATSALIAACTVENKKTDDDGGGGSGGTGATTTAGPGTGPATGPTTTTMMGGGICDSGASTTNAALDACLTGACCDTFNACNDDQACRACLDNPQGAGCGTNAMLNAYFDCADDNCATDMCDTGLGYSFDAAGMEPNFPCNNCVNDSATACMHLGDCVNNDPSVQANVDACLDCVNDPKISVPFAETPMPPTDMDTPPSECFPHGAAIWDAAIAFQQARRTDCATPCFGQ